MCCGAGVKQAAQYVPPKGKKKMSKTIPVEPGLDEIPEDQSDEGTEAEGFGWQKNALDSEPTEKLPGAYYGNPTEVPVDKDDPVNVSAREKDLDKREADINSDYHTKAKELADREAAVEAREKALQK